VRASKGGVTLSGADSSYQASSRWQASVLVVAKDNLNRSIAGATISAKLRYYQRDGNNNSYQWNEQVVTLTSGADGTVAWQTDWYKVNGNGSVLAVQFLVEGVQLPGNLAWDQSRPSATVTPD
jgi:hypothetical protein